MLLPDLSYLFITSTGVVCVGSFGAFLPSFSSYFSFFLSFFKFHLLIFQRELELDFFGFALFCVKQISHCHAVAVRIKTSHLTDFGHCGNDWLWLRLWLWLGRFQPSQGHMQNTCLGFRLKALALFYIFHPAIYMYISILSKSLIIHNKPYPPVIPSLVALYSRGVDPRLNSISGFMASDWHPTPSKDSWLFGGTANIGLNSSVGKSAGTSHQRSLV